MSDTCRPTKCIIDLDAYNHNLDVIEDHVGGAKVVPVIKADAYGHSLRLVVPELIARATERVAVALIEEAVRVRAAGFAGHIHVLGPTAAGQEHLYRDQDVEHTVVSVAALDQLVRAVGGQRCQVHLKLDTGMGRLGVIFDQAETLIAAAVRHRSVEVVGVFSHFANADSGDLADARQQLERFHQAVEVFEKLGEPRPLRHMANSGGVAQLPESHLDLVRPGILTYGVYPSPETERTIDVRPVLSWHTKTSAEKVVPAGWPVGYGSTWRATAPTYVATLPVGYADGYLRHLSNRSDVLIGGKRRAVIGRVSMDQTVVEIGPADPNRPSAGSAATDVVLLGRDGEQHIDAEELAGQAGTIAYEVLTSISVRVPRVPLGGTPQITIEP
ncbi:MAG: alanine racemase [Actinobacteria bacterium]|nr:alanine racemase [Actinomycetota bacterium]